MSISSRQGVARRQHEYDCIFARTGIERDVPISAEAADEQEHDVTPVLHDCRQGRPETHTGVDKRLAELLVVLDVSTPSTASPEAPREQLTLSVLETASMVSLVVDRLHLPADGERVVSEDPIRTVGRSSAPTSDTFLYSNRQSPPTSHVRHQQRGRALHHLHRTRLISSCGSNYVKPVKPENSPVRKCT